VCGTVKKEELIGVSEYMDSERRLALETVNVLTTMTMLAAITARKQIMLMPRRMFKMMKPGPASFLLVSAMPSLNGRGLDEKNRTVTV
jgi:hypothetical protein